jgi:hypothetical protein
MVTNSFFVISLLPTLCSHFKVGRNFAQNSAEYYIREIRMFRRRFAECSAEGSPNVPQNIILGGRTGLYLHENYITYLRYHGITLS